MRFVWTKRAVGAYRRNGTLDPRHTVSNVEVDLTSPWLASDMDRRANGAPWILVDAETGHIVKGSATYYLC